MTKSRIMEFLRERARIERYPSLKRFHHRTHEHDFWAFSRDAVARGVAIGFFFGILTPVAQFVFALVAGVVLRANLIVAAASTLITNPLILPFVYLYAFRIGDAITGRSPAPAADVEASEEAAERALDVADWLSVLLDWVSGVGFPLLIGVLCLATAAGLIGYLCVHAAWASVAGIREYRKRGPGGPRS